MRLAFVTETYPPEINGVALTVQSLVERLRERGHRVELTRPRQPGDDRGATPDDEFRVASHALPRYPGLKAVPHAIFCGLQTGVELATHYASGDLLVFPSLSETFGNVTLEALASGVPVVAFTQGAALEYVRNGSSGITVAPDDAAGFVEACVALGVSREDRAAIAARARAEVAGLHPQQVAVDFENLVKTFTHGAGAHTLPVIPPAVMEGGGVP